MAFFTDFNVRGHVGLLDWYKVSIAILAVVMLAAHGATYLTLKTEGLGSSSLVRPYSNEAGGSQLRHGPTFMTRQNAILNDN